MSRVRQAGKCRKGTRDEHAGGEGQWHLMDGQGKVFVGPDRRLWWGGTWAVAAEAGSSVVCLPNTVYRDVTSPPGCRWTPGRRRQGEQCEHNPQPPFPEDSVGSYLHDCKTSARFFLEFPSSAPLGVDIIPGMIN